MVGLPTQIADQTETKHPRKFMKNTKRRQKYDGRVLNVEKGTGRPMFTPLVFFTSGGLPPKCKQFLNRLAELHVVKRKTRYQDVA